ncbi:hypothetical protein J4465_02240 [Candidatus Pacearchaeota archaeon]|nr:hypothetical protein [Candidatus Pacearchaeota archaeon]
MKNQKENKKSKKINYWIPIVIIIGLLTLFFFPEPETNFLAYVGTALFFILIIIFLSRKTKKKKGK